MKKRISILIGAVLLLSLLFPATAFGATASVSMKGAKSAGVGDTLTITVTYKGDALGYVNGQITYDTDKLEYLSGGSSQGDAGLVELKSYASDATGKLSFNVKFKAVGSGSTNLTLETLETQNLDGDQSMGNPSANRSLSIAAAQTQTTESTAAEETTAEETEVTQTTETSGAVAEDTQETDVSAADDGQNAGGVNYVIVGVVAAVILILIAIIAIALKRKGKK